jgi:hypothetical protein
MAGTPTTFNGKEFSSLINGIETRVNVWGLPHHYFMSYHMVYYMIQHGVIDDIGERWDMCDFLINVGEKRKIKITYKPELDNTNIFICEFAYYHKSANIYAASQN